MAKVGVPGSCSGGTAPVSASCVSRMRRAYARAPFDLDLLAAATLDSLLYVLSGSRKVGGQAALAGLLRSATLRFSFRQQTRVVLAQPPHHEVAQLQGQLPHSVGVGVGHHAHALVSAD